MDISSKFSKEFLSLLKQWGWKPTKKSELINNAILKLEKKGYLLNDEAKQIIKLFSFFYLDIRTTTTQCQPIDFDINNAFWRDSSEFQEVYDFFDKKLSPVASVFHNNGYLWCDDTQYYVTFWPGEILIAGNSFEEAINNILFAHNKMKVIGEIEYE